MRKKKIDNNNLLPYFTDNHEDLPKDYLEECEKFFDELTAKRVREAMNLKPGEVDDDHSEREGKHASSERKNQDS